MSRLSIARLSEPVFQKLKKPKSYLSAYQSQGANTVTNYDLGQKKESIDY